MKKEKKQTIFIGSSSESLKVAEALEFSLQRYRDLEIDAWYHSGNWSFGQSTLESLERRLQICDFALLVLTEDDLIESRGRNPQSAPRDNVIF